jgi:hypothetical protein
MLTKQTRGARVRSGCSEKSKSRGIRVFPFRPILLLVALSLFAMDGLPEERLALLIGNSDYPSEVGRLYLPHNDVELIGKSLQKADFSVTIILDANEDEMNDAFSEFEKRIGRLEEQGDNTVAFVYYSGHGASATVDGRSSNYFIPSRESITTTSELVRKGVSVDEVITGLYLTGADAIFVVADACRSEFVSSFDRSGAKGFVRMPARGGVLIAHSTYPGATAPDDGHYAATLAKYIQTPDLEVSRVFQLASREVAKQRRSLEIPTVANALPEDFCFMPCPGLDALKTQVLPKSDQKATNGLPLVSPVQGYLVNSFNANLSGGGQTEWVTIRTTPGGQVFAPVRGSVEYARPFRSFGSMLILRTEIGQHLILTGMSELNVTEGSMVGAGDPVGFMPDQSVPPPELNFEFRSGDRALDPLSFFLNLEMPPLDEH